VSTEIGDIPRSLARREVDGDVPKGDDVRVVAVSAQASTAPAFRARVLSFRRELIRLGVRLEPWALFGGDEAEAFSAAGWRQRATAILRARRGLADRLAEAGDTHGVAMIQRQVDFLPFLNLERRVAEGRRLVWDVDDAIWLDSSRAAGGHRLAALKGTRRKVRWLAGRADHIVAANAYLAEFLSRYSSRITIVPSVVEPRAVRPRNHADGPDLVLGWIGSPTTARYVHPLTRAISRVARELRDRSIRLLLVGGTMRAEKGFVVESVPWSVEAELEALGRIDVGLMPMPDNAWTRGKSAYKALQYMSAGIPVVADDVGVARNVIEPVKSGFVVRTGDEWVEALLTLAHDSRLRTQFGRQGRRRVEQEFSVERWAPVIAEILRGKH
jgi:glycosyltransferase involved in cell wall biosynthesis